MVGECLESYRSPLLSEFDMAIPQSLVTVYVASDTRKVSEYASQLAPARAASHVQSREMAAFRS